MDERPRWRRRLIALTVAFLAVGVGAIVVGGPDNTGVRLTTDADRVADGRQADTSSRPIVPAAPDDGTASRGLPVGVDPAEALHDDQTVTVSGSAFTPGSRVGVVMCRQNAREGGGIDHCDISRVAYADVGADGTFTATTKVMRFIVTPADGEIDCAAAARACVVAAGNLADYDESGGAAVAFEWTPPPPPPAIAVIDDRLGDGDVVRVVGSGYRTQNEVMVMQCPADDAGACLPVATVSPEDDGSYDIPVKVWRYLTEDTDCAARRCVLRTLRTDGLRPASTELDFDAERTERAAPPSARVDPTRGLRDGDILTVNGTAFAPSTRVGLAICVDGADACVPVGDSVIPDVDGSIHATARVTAIVPSDHDETGRVVGNTDCRTTSCHLAIMTMPGRTSPLRFEVEFAA